MIIRGGTIVTARGVERADIVIADGRIVEVGANLDESGTEIDAKGLHAFCPRPPVYSGGIVPAR